MLFITIEDKKITQRRRKAGNMKAKKYFSLEIVNATTDPNTNNNITDKISNDKDIVHSSFKYFSS